MTKKIQETEKVKHPECTIFSRFSKTLAYNQTDANIVSVHNWPENRKTSTEHILNDLKLKDFYNSKNISAFMTYTKALIVNENGEVGCAIVLGTENGRGIQIQIMRPNIGKLMEVLFCFKFSGIPLGDSFEQLGSPDASLVSVARLLLAYQAALERDASEETWEFLNNWTNIFYNICQKGYEPEFVSDYITNELCIGRPVKM